MTSILRGRQGIRVVRWEHLRIAESESVARIVRVSSSLAWIPNLRKLAGRWQHLRRPLGYRSKAARRGRSIGCFQRKLARRRQHLRRPLGYRCKAARSWWSLRCLFDVNFIVDRRASLCFLLLRKTVWRPLWFRLHHGHESFHLLHGLGVHLA